MKAILTITLVLIFSTMLFSAPVGVSKSSIIQSAKSETISGTEKVIKSNELPVSVKALEKGRRILEYKYKLYA